MVRVSVCPSLTEGLSHSQMTLGQMLAVDHCKMFLLKPSHCSGEGLGDDQGKHKRPEQHTMTRPRSKTLQWRPARLASSRGYVFSGAAPSGASGSGEGMRVCRELPASSCRPTPDHRGRGQLRRPLSARAPPPRPRPLRGDPAI